MDWFIEIEQKWQQKWEQAEIFQPKIEQKEKFYLTAAFPYPNSPQHIGHGRTYTTTDIYARYMRLKGKNVLFPMAFHVTGTPIIAMAKRIKEKDKEILDIFQNIYGISLSTIEKLTDPKDLVLYFSDEIEKGMKEMGYSIDWRRKFYTYDLHFNKFIEWQFLKLMQAGFIKKGEHPVPWCPIGNTAVGAHDTKGDIDPQISQITLILFHFEDGFLPCATYRPETIFGVTNIWINPNVQYLKVSDGKMKYYFSEDSFEYIKFQFSKDLVVEDKISGSALVNKHCENPINNKSIPILPATFVDPKNGSGIVMSVPAHAPYDYLALKDLGLENKIELIQVLEIEGFGVYPAKEIVEKMQIKYQNDPKAKEATEILYKKEAHKGKIIVGDYKGMLGVDAKEKIREDLIKKGFAFPFYEIANGPIYSRYGGLVCVKIVKDQWFIDYSNLEWKNKTKECFSGMKIFPENLRKDYLYVIDWLKEKACTRSLGLGTAFPFDKTKMIEALSDSTIYMAFYTIAHLIKKLDPNELTEELFDYVFLGKSSSNKLPELAEQMRKEFLYWYPLDSRHSATDLIHNHLVFFIFNHVAIFPKEKWPKQIVTNGFVLMDGKKMSKSMGNILPLRNAIKEFGADSIRFTIVSGADLTSDSDFNRPAVEGVLSRMKYLKDVFEKYVLNNLEENKELENYDHIDKWLYSKLYKQVSTVEQLYDKFQFRELALELFYNTYNNLQWYLKRTRKPKLREFFEVWTILFSPFMPHFTEELWAKLGKKRFVEDAEFVSVAKMPKANAQKIDEEIEKIEEYILKIREDINSILRIIKLQHPSKIDIFIASDWKRHLHKIISKEKDYHSIIKAANSDPKIPKGEIFHKTLKNLIKMKETEILTKDFELNALNSALELLKEEFKVDVVIHEEEHSENQKAHYALPGKPSILIS